MHSAKEPPEIDLTQGPSEQRYQEELVYLNRGRRARTLPSKRTSFVKLYRSESATSTELSSRNFSTAAAHQTCHSSLDGLILTVRAFLAIEIQSSSVPGPAVRNMRPEKRLFTRFSSKLMVSTRVVTPTTAMPLLSLPARQL